jgi:hypothetical protein
MSACRSCGTPGPWRTCPVCAGDELAAIEAGLIPRPEPYRDLDHYDAMQDEKAERDPDD